MAERLGKYIPVRVTSMGQINLFKNHFYLIGLYTKNKRCWHNKWRTTRLNFCWHHWNLTSVTITISTQGLEIKIKKRYHMIPPNSLLICVVFHKFPDFFVQAFTIVVDSWKFTMLLLYILWDDWPFFMISATARIGIHPTKAWLSQLVNFKNAIWTWGHFRRMIRNKILF